MKPEDIPFDDQETLALLSRGETVGIFQVDSFLGKKTCMAVQPESLEDVVAIMALTRPGSIDNKGDEQFVRHKRAGVRSPDIHPELNEALTPVLAGSYGILLYQEQVMEVIALVTGWGYAEAEDIFTAMRKKKFDKMEASKPSYFREGFARGYSQEALQALWDVLVPFSDYSFNRSHSMGYAYITYRGAYLKTHHKKEYMAALLSHAKKTPQKNEPLLFAQEAERLGIALLRPDINLSKVDFLPKKDGIRYGLSAIPGVGDSAAGAVLEGQPYENIHDFFDRAHPTLLNRGVFEALTQAGCFDAYWPSRTELLEQGTEIGKVALNHRRQKESGQPTILPARYCPDNAWKGEAGARAAEEDSRRKSAYERELLGFSITRPRIRFNLSRHLSGEEWHYVRQQLTYYPGDQELQVRYGSTVFSLPLKVRQDSRLVAALNIIGIEVEEV